MSKPLTHISIVGFGRFGRVLYRLFKDDFVVTVFRRSGFNDLSEFAPTTTVAKTISEIYKNDVVFFAVPIESFEQVIASHQCYFNKNHLLIDVLSVKLFPAMVFEKYLIGTEARAMLTHPMFGPDSSRKGFIDLPIIMSQFRATNDEHTFWKHFFESKGLNVIEMSPDTHDELAANSQGLTHMLGRMLERFGLKESSIDTFGTKKLLEVKKLTCNDTWQLFSNLQQFNPYAKEMRIKLGQAYTDICDQLENDEDNQVGLE